MRIAYSNDKAIITFDYNPTLDEVYKAENRVKNWCDKNRPQKTIHTTWGGFWQKEGDRLKKIQVINFEPCLSRCCQKSFPVDSYYSDALGA